MEFLKYCFKSIKAELICYICLLTIIPLLFVCTMEYYINKNTIKRQVLGKLTSIADLKKEEINNWLQERLIDTSVIANYNLLAADATAVLEKRKRFRTIDLMKNYEVGQFIYKRLENNLYSLKEIYKYYDVISIIDSLNGEIVLSTNTHIVGGVVDILSNYMDILNNEKISGKNMYSSELFGENYVTCFSPIYMTDPVTLEKSDIVIGLLLLDISMKNSIEPLIQNWQGMGNTGETLLVKREEDTIRYLNSLRHMQSQILNFATSVSSVQDITCILSSRGEEGFLECFDYRNVPVFSAYRHIPILNWGLVAKQDVREAFAPIKKLRTRLIMFTGISIAIIISIIVLLTNRITQPILRLVQGVKAIASGNLDHRISVDSRTEVGLLAREFNDMAAKLKESYSDLEHKVEERTAQLLRSERFAAVGELAAEVAHEINNPLAGLQNFAGMLENEPENISQTKKYATLMFEGLKRVEMIVKRLLAFSRPYSFYLSENDINTVINSSLEFIEHRMDYHELCIQKDLNTSLPSVFIDPDLISQVFINVMLNAVESMPNGGTITIKTDTCVKHRECISVSIMDTGCGISEEIMEKIFEPFFTTKNIADEKGLGMGLAISKRIIADHQGEIHIKSSPGKGTCLKICIPSKRTAQ
ncbi:MAG: ATP-binding protein [Candidatus Brocadiaceae bacterium]|nr:ATP-binding protein [Candidatus Brocadiaceae bacterium]